MKRILALAVYIVCLLASVVGAHEQRRVDADDVKGRLDIESVSFRHVDDGLVFNVRTLGRWGNKQLLESKAFVAIELKQADSDFGFCAVARGVGQDPVRLTGQLFRNSAERCDYITDSGIGPVMSSRPGPRSIRIKLPFEVWPELQQGGTWRAVTSFERSGHKHCWPSNDGVDGLGRCVDRTKPRTHPSV